MKKHQDWGSTEYINRNQFSAISYKDILKNIFANYNYETYLEIGTNKGHSIRWASNDCIGVDPKFIIEGNIMNNKRSLMLFQKTSDKFFEEDAGKIFLDKKISLSFIDGLHLSEQVIKDFLNTLKYSTEDFLIILHDVIPRTYESSLRDRVTRFWTGDVWRACKTLNHYFSSKLKFSYVNCPPSGLLFISNRQSDDSPNKIDSYNLEEILHYNSKINSKELSQFLKGLDYFDSQDILNFFNEKVDNFDLDDFVSRKFNVK